VRNTRLYKKKKITVLLSTFDVDS